MTRLTVEVRGIGFPNKGAELMLDACVEFVHSRLAASRVTVIPYGPKRYAMDQLRQRGIVPRLHVPRLGRHLNRVLSLVPAGLRNGEQCTVAGDEDVILDASGFAYGDVWGAWKAGHRAAMQSLALRRNPQLKVVFLPQAFGPFTDPLVASHTREILAPAKLIFPRDDESRAHLESIGIADDRVRVVPDFTNLVSPGHWPGRPMSPGTVGLIPNERLREQPGYVELFAAVADALQRDGHPVAFLLHEGARDEAVIEAIVVKMNTDASAVLKPVDARAVKACIGAFALVVGSRFHGLVSALNQGVPVVAIGWSHKYRALMQDYGLEEFSGDFPVGAAWVLSRIDQLLSSECAAIKQRLAAVNDRHLQAVRTMWDDVERVCVR